MRSCEFCSRGAGICGVVAHAVLASTGHDVVGLDTDCTRVAIWSAPGLRLTPRRHPRRPGGGLGRLRRGGSPRRALERPDRRARRGLTYAVNHEATVRLAELAPLEGRALRLRIVLRLTAPPGRASRSTRAPPLAPLTAYAESKVRSERSLAEMSSDAFSPVSLRFATAYGVSPRLRLDIVLNNLVGWALTTGAVRLQSDGTAWRPLIHVEDMAGAIAARARRTRGSDPRPSVQRGGVQCELHRP